MSDEYLKLKATGKKPVINHFKSWLAAVFIVVPTSEVIQHHEDDMSHQYLLVYGKPCPHRVLDHRGASMCTSHDGSVGECRPGFCPRRKIN